MVTAQWFVNDSLIATEKNIVVDKETMERSFDVGKYLKVGNNIVKLYLNNDEGSVKNTMWTVNSVDVKITSDFKEENNLYLLTYLFFYTAYGSVNKKIIAELNGGRNFFQLSLLIKILE